MGRLFNGTTDFGLTSGLDLSLYRTVSVSVWVNTSTWQGGTNASVFGFNTGAYSPTGSILFDIGGNTAGNPIHLVHLATVTNAAWQDYFAPPSLNVWNHYVATFDAVTPAVALCINGVLTAPGSVVGTGVHNGTAPGRFISGGAMSIGRAGATTGWYKSGSYVDFAVWGNLLLKGPEALMLYKGADPRTIRPDLLAFYDPLDGAGISDSVYGRTGSLSPVRVALTGTTGTAGPLGIFRRRVVRRKVAVIA